MKQEPPKMTAKPDTASVSFQSNGSEKTAPVQLQVDQPAPRELDHDHHQHVAEESSTTLAMPSDALAAEENGRERLKRHRGEVAGRVWIPDMWGQEELLKDWIDCSAFDESLVPSGIMSARAALAEEGRRASSGGLRIENRC